MLGANWHCLALHWPTLRVAECLPLLSAKPDAGVQATCSCWSGWLAQELNETKSRLERAQAAAEDFQRRFLQVRDLDGLLVAEGMGLKSQANCRCWRMHSVY